MQSYIFTTLRYGRGLVQISLKQILHKQVQSSMFLAYCFFFFFALGYVAPLSLLADIFKGQAQRAVAPIIFGITLFTNNRRIFRNGAVSFYKTG